VPINIKQQMRQFVVFFMAFALALFLPAGTLVWPAGWIFLMLFFSFYLAITVWLFRHNPGLLQERMSLRTSDQQGWDKVLFPLLVVFLFAWLMFISFDAVRFHYSPVPVWLQLVGALVLLCSFALLFLTFRENSYLSPVVRIQDERGHTMVSSGP
jgi:protein-S-isoprenylcysteine O-methyltransferase Ste14